MSSVGRARAIDWPLAILAGALVTSLAFRDGGYFAVDWGWSSLVLFWIAASVLLLRDRIALARAEVAMVAALAAFLAWTALSSSWSTSVERSVLEVQRGLVYLAALVTLFLVARGRSTLELLAGVAAAAATISTVALGWLFFGRVSASDTAFGALSAPLSYPNALAMVAVIGALIASALAAHANMQWPRALAGAALVVFALTIYFTFSRGAWIVLAVGGLAMLVVDPRRADLLRANAVALPFVSIAVFLASRADALATLDPDTQGSARQGYLMAAAAFVLAGAAAVATARTRQIALRSRAAAAGAVVMLVLLVAGSAAVLAQHRQAGSPDRPPLGTTQRNEGLVLALSGRLPVWRQAWRDWKHHVILGSGAGTFEQWWLQHRRSSLNVRDAHNLYLETLAEVGLVGLVLLLAMLTLPPLLAARARSQPFAPAALAAFVAYAVHAAGDWDWEMPAVTLLGLFCGAAFVLAVRPEGRRALSLPVRAATVVGALALALVALDGLVGNGALAASTRAVDAARWSRAAEEARTARRWLPWSSDAWLRHAEARIGQGDLHAAHGDLVTAAHKSREDWRVWWSVMRIDRGRKRRLALAQATRLNPRAPEVVQFLLAPGSLNAARSYNDAWRGWPVAPVHRQHHVRSAFLDPRRGTLAAGGEAAYHIGIDIAVRDDRPEPGAPPGRTHRVYAIEGGYVFLPPRQHARACVNRRVAIGHFDYWHVDTVGVVAEGEQIRPGQMIGWTCKGLNHVHLSETMVLDGRLVYVNPLHGGWKLAPYTDREPPRIHAIRFFGTAMPAWRPWPRLSLPEAGIRFSRMRAGHIRVSGYVDVRAWIDDDGSPPYSIALEVVRERDNKRVLRRTVFRSAVLLTDRLVTQPVPIGYHYAPGTVAGAAYWFRLFARPGGAYWRTESVPNGNYRLEVTARDVAGNVATATARVTVAN